MADRVQEARDEASRIRAIAGFGAFHPLCDHVDSLADRVAALETALRQIAEFGVSIIEGHRVCSGDVTDIARAALAGGGGQTETPRD